MQMILRFGWLMKNIWQAPSGEKSARRSLKELLASAKVAVKNRQRKCITFHMSMLVMNICLSLLQYVTLAMTNYTARNKSSKHKRVSINFVCASRS